MPITSYAQLLKTVQHGKTKRLAVAAAQGEEILRAVARAAEMAIVQPVLLGDTGMMAEISDRVGLNIAGFEKIDESDPIEAAARAVDMVARGTADLLMKGKLSTPDILRLVLEEKRGLRTGRLLSHVAVVEVKGYPKLLIFTDGGMVIQPDLDQKVDILKNAIFVANRLGIQVPKVAVLASLETVHPDIPETLDAARLVEMSQRDELPPAVIEGPLAMDIAVSQRAAEMKGVRSAVAGDVDILLVPNIASGNIGVKGLVYLTGAQVGGVILGAKSPIVLLSRSDTVEAKLHSIALGALLC
ncbi:bifunctional enoyl-CoA hydratase/phosphate acetyltransferase [Candidatus Zixiibacteriota bacterium]